MSNDSLIKEMTSQSKPAVLELPPLLAGKCRYPRLRGEDGTALMIQADYFLQLECVRGFEQCGWKCITLPMLPSENFVERLLMAVATHRPDLLFTVNHFGFDELGALAGLLEAMELPYVSWYVDSPAYILLNHTHNASPLAITPVWERSYLPFLKGFGFEHAFHLPLGGDPDLFGRGRYGGGRSFQVSYVADSGVDPSAKWLAQSQAFEGKEKLVTAAATTLLGDRRIPPLELLPQTASELQIELPELDAAGSLALGSAIVLEATKLSRRRVVGALAPFPLDVFGDEGWLGQLPSQARYHPKLDYYTELSNVYAETAVNINATNYQMPTAVNQRVFDAPLAGGFLISDNQEDLQLLFDPDEYVTYSRLSDLTDEVRFYLPQISLRLRVAEKAVERILAEHTFRHRIKTIINYARKAFGSRDFANVRTVRGVINTETTPFEASTP